MNESKINSEIPIITVDKLMCGPSFCPIADKINLKIDFTPERTLNNAVWDLKVHFHLMLVYCRFSV